MGSTVIKPGKETEFLFPYIMHPGMGGKHHFEVRIGTNEPAQPRLVIRVYGNSVEGK